MPEVLSGLELVSVEMPNQHTPAEQSDLRIDSVDLLMMSLLLLLLADCESLLNFAQASWKAVQRHHITRHHAW